MRHGSEQEDDNFKSEMLVATNSKQLNEKIIMMTGSGAVWAGKGMPRILIINGLKSKHICEQQMVEQQHYFG